MAAPGACKATGQDYAPAEGAVSLFKASGPTGTIPARYVTRQGSVLDVQFADPTVRATFKIQTHPAYFTLAVRSITGDVDWLQFCDLRPALSGTVGTLVNAAWDQRFATCVLACNDLTHSFGASAPSRSSWPAAIGRYGMQGARSR